MLRNDEVTVDQVLAYDGVLLSPGPGTPTDAFSACIDIVKLAGSKVPILAYVWAIRQSRKRSAPQ